MANSNEVKSDGKAAAAAGSGGGSSGASVPVSASVVVGTDKDAAGKTRPMPKDAQVMVAILKDMGITDYEPRVVNQMLEFSYRYVTNVLDDAKVMSAHARKKAVDVDDVKLAVQMYSEQNMTSPPSRDVLLDFARAKNSAPLPVPRSTCGLRLPPDRHCLTACNYRYVRVVLEIRTLLTLFNLPTMGPFQIASEARPPSGSGSRRRDESGRRWRLLAKVFGLPADRRRNAGADERRYNSAVLHETGATNGRQQVRY